MGKDKKQVRKSFRDAVFKRDNYTCRVCGKKWTKDDAEPALGRINAHHITDRNLMPNGGYVVENGITVCDGEEDSCHMRCESWHITGNGEEELHPDKLYGRIDSSLEKAIKAANKL